MDHSSTCPLQIRDKVQSRNDKSMAIMGQQKNEERVRELGREMMGGWVGGENSSEFG